MYSVTYIVPQHIGMQSVTIFYEDIALSSLGSAYPVPLWSSVPPNTVPFLSPLRGLSATQDMYNLRKRFTGCFTLLVWAPMYGSSLLFMFINFTQFPMLASPENQWCWYVMTTGCTSHLPAEGAKHYINRSSSSWPCPLSTANTTPFGTPDCTDWWSLGNEGQATSYQFHLFQAQCLIYTCVFLMLVSNLHNGLTYNSAAC